MNITRKKFIKSLAAGLGGSAMLNVLPSFGNNDMFSDSKGKTLDSFHEQSRHVPVIDNTDVIICGGGPAGIAAALAAARTGAKVRLFEVHGCLGGVWTSGMLAWLFDFDKPGITNELTKELTLRGARRGTNPKQYVYEIEEMKLLLEEKLTEAGVKFQLFTRVVAAYTDRNKRLTTIITESKSGRQAWKAKAFIDATGDGDLGALAGNGWDYGFKDTGITQPMTFMSLITVKDPIELKDFISFYEGDSEHRKKHVAFNSELKKAGITPSYGHPTLFQIRDNLIALMVNHEYGVKPFDAAQVTTATINGRAEVNKVVRALRNLGGRWDGVQLVASCEQIGVREGRRLHGHYTVTESDLVQGLRHKDGIAHVTFGIDIHAATLDQNHKQTIRNTTDSGLRMKPYDIPIRALIAKDVDGLLMAGRCISGDFIAHASYRVTGNAVAMGEAAGTLASVASLSNKLPHEVAWIDVSEALKSIRR